MSDHTLDGIRIALAIAFAVGMIACATQAALLTNGGEQPHDHSPPHVVRWIYRLAGFLSLLAALELLTRV